MNKHREMILNPLEWPIYPHLPLKRPNEQWFDPAFLVASTMCISPRKDSINQVDPSAPITILLGIVYQKLEGIETKTYENVDALLADGWLVD